MKTLVTLCLVLGLFVTGVATAIYAGHALFWFSSKAALLFGGALTLTIGQARLLKAIQHKPVEKRE